MSHVPTVAIVGVPNAGKSTLLNRLTGSRVAVVHAIPGVTRDRKIVDMEWSGRTYRLIDTGGFDAGDESVMAGQIRVQVRTAIEEADAVLFVVDGRAGPLAGDYEIADVIRRSRLPVLLVANKIDDPHLADQAATLHELGLGAPLPVSAVHGTGTGDLLDALAELVPGRPAEEGDEAEASIEIPLVIVGRPNAGKSSLLNALVGEDRVIVSDVPGTTRDAIDTTFEWRGRHVRVVDTAGMRKAAKLEGIEYYSYLRSLSSLDRAHVAIVVVDATLGAGELDVSIAAEAMRRGCATVLAVNKTDIAGGDLDEVRDIARRKLRQRPETVPVSATERLGLDPLMRLVVSLESRYTAHIPTPALNRALGEITGARPMPGKGRRRLKTYFIAQYQTAPPRFMVDVNDRSLVTRDWGFYVENRLRERFELQGVPLIIDFKVK